MFARLALSTFNKARSFFGQGIIARGFSQSECDEWPLVVLVVDELALGVDTEAEVARTLHFSRNGLNNREIRDVESSKVAYFVIDAELGYTRQKTKRKQEKTRRCRRDQSKRLISSSGNAFE